MKKILQAFKRLFSRKKKERIIYICDPEKAIDCSKEGCWHLKHGPCKCTKHKAYAKVNENGKPITAKPIDIWNEEYREYCLMHPELYFRGNDLL